MSKATPVSDADFTKEVIESTVPVVVDFWATWCGPCQVMGPIVDTVAGEYEGKIKVFKMNVDENPATPAKYGIRAVVVFANPSKSHLGRAFSRGKIRIGKKLRIPDIPPGSDRYFIILGVTGQWPKDIWIHFGSSMDMERVFRDFKT